MEREWRWCLEDLSAEMIRDEREEMMMRVVKKEGEGVSGGGDDDEREEEGNVDDENDTGGERGWKRKESAGGNADDEDDARKMKMKMKKKRRTVEHGNYGAYYGYRLTENGDDPRMDLFKSEWYVMQLTEHSSLQRLLTCYDGMREIDRKRGLTQARNCARIIVCICIHTYTCIAQQYGACVMVLVSINRIRGRCVLDIGCNEGMVPLKLLEPQFGADRVFGLDIDASLVRAAKRNTRLRSDVARATFMACDAASEAAWPDEVRAQRFGCITCLSVTKWIQLHHGDAGIERLFTRIADALEIGGVFILGMRIPSFLNFTYLNFIYTYIYMSNNSRIHEIHLLLSMSVVSFRVAASSSMRGGGIQH